MTRGQLRTAYAVGFSIELWLMLIALNGVPLTKAIITIAVLELLSLLAAVTVTKAD